MKKIILLLFLLCIFINVKAVYFYYGDTLVPNMYMVRNSGAASESSAVYLVKRVDTKEFAYCIEPLTLLNRDSNYIEYNYNNQSFNLSDDIIKKINLIAYYGYMYKGHEDIQWYGITQFLIWKTIYSTYTFYFADARFGNMVSTYDDKVIELMNLVDKDLAGLKLNNNYNLKTGYEYTLINNQLLNDYEIVNNDNLNIYIKDNKLIVKSLKAGNYQVKLKHKNWRFNHYFLYDSQDAQDLFINGYIDDEITINLFFKDTLLTVYKVDSDSSVINNLTTDGAIYNLYDDKNNLVSSSEVIDGKMEFLLPLGTYYLKEVKPSYGFLKNENKEKIILDTEKDYYVYEDKILKHLKLHKQYNDKKELYNEEDALFDLYLDNEKITTLKTDCNGLIEIDLPYGNYRLVQVKGLDNYNLAKEIYITIDANYQEDTIEVINYKKEVLGSKVIILNDVPNTSIYNSNTCYPLIDVIKIIIYVFKKIYL